jgi:hypothetical protein
MHVAAVTRYGERGQDRDLAYLWLGAVVKISLNTLHFPLLRPDLLAFIFYFLILSILLLVPRASISSFSRMQEPVLFHVTYHVLVPT